MAGALLGEGVFIFWGRRDRLPHIQCLKTTEMSSLSQFWMLEVQNRDVSRAALGEKLSQPLVYVPGSGSSRPLSGCTPPVPASTSMWPSSAGSCPHLSWVMQDDQLISGSLTECHLQRPFLQVRPHSQRLGTRNKTHLLGESPSSIGQRVE